MIRSHLLELLHLSRASLKRFLWTSNWKMVLSQSVEALSLPPCFLRNASKPFSEGYFSLPMNTTEVERDTFELNIITENKALLNTVMTKQRHE